MRFHPDRCPACDEVPIGTVEKMFGNARLLIDGTGKFTYEGNTEIWGDSQVTVTDHRGRPLLTCASSHTWYATKE